MPNFLDKIIEFLSPEWAARREQTRTLIEAHREARSVRAGYEGATQGRRAEHWSVSSRSPTAETQSALSLLRDRARDLVRNNCHAERAVDVYVNNCIGTGIRPSIPGDQQLEERLKVWASETDADADALHNFYGIQHLAMRAVREAGECFIVREWAPELLEQGQIPIRLRVLEGDYCPETKWESRRNGNEIVQGVEFDSRGRRVAYWLYDQHPGDRYGRRKTQLDARRVPASEVIHWFDCLRPGQVRGVTPFAPVMLKMRDFDEYEDAQLMRQKIAACFTAFVRKDPTGLWSPTKSAKEDSKPIGEKVEPGMIEILRPGESVEFGSPPRVEDYRDFADITLHDIAAGLGLSYEALTTNLSDVNFSSIRMGHLEFQRKIDADREKTIKPRVLSKAAGWLLEALFLMQEATGEESVKWTPPRREQISPQEETRAALGRIRAGLSSLQEEIRKRGRDPDDVFEEIAKDQEKLDELDIILDSDPRRQNANGTPRPDVDDAA